MKIAIIGSRSITERGTLFDQITDILAPHAESRYGCFTILSGGATGVDRLAREYAELMLFDFVLFKPYHLLDNRVQFEPKYFFARNRQIVDNADMVISIWYGDESDVAYMVNYAQKRNVPVKQIIVSDAGDGC